MYRIESRQSSYFTATSDFPGVLPRLVLCVIEGVTLDSQIIADTISYLPSDVREPAACGQHQNFVLVTSVDHIQHNARVDVLKRKHIAENQTIRLLTEIDLREAYHVQGPSSVAKCRALFRQNAAADDPFDRAMPLDDQVLRAMFVVFELSSRRCNSLAAVLTCRKLRIWLQDLSSAFSPCTRWESRACCVKWLACATTKAGQRQCWSN